MSKQIFATIFGGLCIFFGLIVTGIDLLSFIYPPQQYIFTLYSDTEAAGGIYRMSLAVFIIIGLLPIMFGLLSFYLADGIGNNIFSKIMIASVVLATLLFIPMILIGFSFEQTFGPKLNIFVIILMLLLGYLFISPIIFTITSLIARKVNLWKRFIPLAAFILLIFCSIILPIVIGVILNSLRMGYLLYQGAKSATVPQWLMLGSLAWGLLSLAVFIKDKKTNTSKSAVTTLPDYV